MPPSEVPASPSPPPGPAPAALRRPAQPTVEELKRIVRRSFAQVYDTQAQGDAVAFYLTLDASRSSDEAFQQVRRDLAEVGRIPVLKYQGGEHVLIVVPKPLVRERGYGLHLALYLATWATTILAGSEVYYNYRYWDLLQPLAGADTLRLLGLLFSPESLWGGFLLFALPLMLVLTVHEMGHFVVARRHGVAASLPFFIPVPPVFLVNIGTMGAFISMDEPIPDRKALLDIGISGPLAGLAVAIPVTLLGLVLMARDPVALPPVDGLVMLGNPLLYEALAAPFHLGASQLVHPLAFAGWVGLLVTGLNLLPAGQLDGGHVAHALLGDRSKYLSFAVVLVLIVLGVGLPAYGVFPGFPGYGGWLVFALLVAFLGVHHPAPLNGLSTLDKGRMVAGWVAMGVLLLCFTPLPLS